MQSVRFSARFTVCLILCIVPAHAQTGDPAAKSRRAKELMAAGKFDEAIPLYRDLTRMLPNSPGPIMNLGLGLHMAGHERESVSQCQAALPLAPTHLPAPLFFAAAYIGLKQPAKAIEPLKEVVRPQPDNKEARLLLGEA